MDPKTIFTVMKSESDKTKIIIGNVLIMLGNRIYIGKDGTKLPLLSVDKFDVEKDIEDSGDGTFTLKTNNGEKYAVKIIFQKITSTGKQSAISDFFKEFSQFKRIIIAKEYNNKISDFMAKHHTQIFRESSFLSDLISYRDQPRFELLSPKEIELFKKEYNTTDYTTKKILRSDPISKYFALRKGDIIRIIRPSPTSGQAIDYRIVS